MTDQSRAQSPSVKPFGSKNYNIADGVSMFTGEIAALRKGDNATSQQEAQKFANAKELFFAGLNFADEVGDSSASPRPKARLSMGTQILDNVAVVGAASVADFLKPIYAADSNNETAWTLTRPSNESPVVAVLLSYNVDGTCDILILGADVRLADVGKQEAVYLGSISAVIAATATVRNGLRLRAPLKITEVYAFIDTALAGASGEATFKLQKVADDTGTPTDIGDGVVSLTTAAALAVGTRVNGSAVAPTSGSNEFGPEDTVDVVATVTTAFTAGRIDLWATAERMA